MVNLFSYKALPTITPSKPWLSNFVRAIKSDNEPTPPEAITGRLVFFKTSLMKSSFGPFKVPSVSISVTIKLDIFKLERSFIKSNAYISD